jgi:hypothetical protein
MFKWVKKIFFKKSETIHVPNKVSLSNKAQLSQLQPQSKNLSNITFVPYGLGGTWIRQVDETPDTCCGIPPKDVLDFPHK